MLGEISRLHSLTRILANKRRKVALSPGYVNYAGRLCSNILPVSCGNRRTPDVFQQPERKYWSVRTIVLLAIAASVLLGFIAGRFSAGLRPRLGWLDPDVLFVEIMFVILVAGALLSTGGPRKPPREDSQSASPPGE